MSKKTLLAKRVLSALVLGSMLYAPAAMAKDVSYSGSQTITESVYGSKSSTGPADSNKVTITNCTIDPTQIQDGDLIIVGGAVENVNGEKSPSTASKNTVKIGESVVVTGTIEDDDVHYYVDVYGGMIVYGDASENKVTVESGSFYDIIGGEVYYEIEGEGDEHDEEFGKGNVSKNIVRVSTTGSFEDVIGGETKEGDATFNEVYVSNGTSKEQSSGDNEPPAIAGGMSWKGNANYNKVEITDGNFDATVDGGLAVGNANNNILSFSNAVMKILNPRSEETGIGISGGWGIIEKDNADALTDTKKQITANENTVTVSNATIGSATANEVATDMYIVGGAVTTEASETLEDQEGYKGPESFKNSNDLVGTANKNIVTIKDGSKIYVDIFGGVLDGGKGTVSENEVIITGSTVYRTTDTAGENAIYGGYVEYGDATGSEVNGNSVSITNSTIGVKVYGGYADSGVVSGNSVSIANSTVNNGADIYGGYVDGDGTGEEKNNSVSLDGVTFVGDGTGNDETRIYGGRHEGGSGNSLHIGAGGFTVAKKTNVTIKRFNAMTFADGAVVTNNGDLTFEKNGDEINPTDIVWTAKIIGTGTTYFEPDSAGEDDSDFTLGNELSTSGGIVVAHDAKLRVQDAGYLGAAVTNKGDVNLYGGTLSKVITNNADGANGTIKIKGDVALTSGANIVGGTLQLKEGGHLMLNNGIKDTLTVGNLEAYSKDDKGNNNYEATDNKISFDAGKSVVDQISATTYKGTITLGSVGLKDEFEGNVGTVVGTYQLFTGSQDYSQLKINGSAEAVMGAYKYVFSDNGSNDGKLKITKDYGYSLQAIIQDSEPEHKAGKVGSYSLNGDKTMDADMGTLTRPDSKVAREFTINGNSHKLLGNGKAGITVNSGDTLTYKDITEVSGFNGAAVTNNGTFNANNVTFKNEIAGNGTMNVDGIVNADAKVSNKMNIAGTGTLNIAGANVANTVANAGILNFLGGNLNYAVTGGGTMNVKNTTVNADVSVAIVNVDNTTLNIASGKNFMVTNKLNMTNAAVVTMDKGNVLDKDLKVKTGSGDIINGVDGILVLRFNGAEYTATAHRDARLALFGDGTTEKAALQFDNAVLKIDEANETLGVQGTKTDNVVTMSGAQPTVYDKSGNPVEGVGDQAERTVGILNSAGGLESADKVSLEGNSNVTAKDLQIKEVATSGQPFAIEVKNNSKLNLTGGDNGLVKDENGKPVEVSLKAETGATINLGKEDEQVGNGKANVKELNVAGVVNVQNIDLNIDTLKVDGGTVVFDPSYNRVTTLDFGSGTVQVVTDGTVVNVGMDKDDLKAALDSAGLATTPSNDGYIVGNGHGVLALGQQVDLTGSGKYLVVDAKGADVTKALQLGAGAVLVAQKEEATADTPVVKLGSKEDASIADTAQLVISADKYQKDGGDFISYIVLDKEADALWAEGNIYAADPTFTFKYDETTKKLVADWNKVEGIFGEGAISAPEMYNRILQKEQNTDANKFLKDVIKNNASAGSTAATKAAGAAALNAVTSLGELAAVNHGLYTVSNQMTDAVANHMSLIDNEEASRDIWAAYIHNKEDVEELKLGGIDADYSAKYNGVVVGADLAKSDKGNVGVALSYVDGDISGASAGVRTRNDAEYYGASLYGRLDGKDVFLLGDISYMHGKGDITQTAMGQEIIADAKSDAISVGVRLEKAFKLGKVGNLMPYIGARYMSINTKDYHNSLGMNYDMDKQNLFMAPVGIAYSAHIEDNGWTYKPTFEAGYVFNMGDKNVDQKVSYNGYGDTFGMDVVDNGYWFGRVGFAAEKKHMAYSLGYQYMKSNNAKNNKYMVNVVWKF